MRPTQALFALVPTLLLLVPASRLGAEPAPPPASESEKQSPTRQVADVLCEKRVAALGEPASHGEAEAFRMKAEVADRLLDECGFEVLLFEAPIYDFLGVEAAAEADRATLAQLERAIGGFWTTRELAEWRARLFERVGAGTLVIGGLDDQVSATSEHARTTLPALIASYSPAEQKVLCREAVERNLFWRYDEHHGFDDTEKKRLARCAEEAHEAAETAGSAASPAERLMLENVSNLYRRQAGLDGALDRDAQMARNLRGYQERLGERRGIIVWTSTVHAARSRQALTHQPMGAHLADRLGEDYGAVGWSAAGGERSRAGMAAQKIAPAPGGSLESKVVGDARFFDREALHRLGPIPARLLRTFAEADWSQSFDGVVIIREERAPSFER